MHVGYHHPPGPLCMVDPRSGVFCTTYQELLGCEGHEVDEGGEGGELRLGQVRLGQALHDALTRRPGPRLRDGVIRQPGIGTGDTRGSGAGGRERVREKGGEAGAAFVGGLGAYRLMYRSSTSSRGLCRMVCTLSGLALCPSSSRLDSRPHSRRFSSRSRGHTVAWWCGSAVA